MEYAKNLIIWVKSQWKNLPVYIFFILPFLAYYLIMRFRVANSGNMPCVLAAMFIFVLVLCYGLFKYLQVEYMKQTYKQKLRKKNNREN